MATLREEATFVRNGEERRDCENCEHYETRETEKSECLFGDVNFDGKVNVIDASLIRKFAAKMADFDENQKFAADVNGDGKVDVIDANLIRKFAAKIISTFPVRE